MNQTNLHDARWFSSRSIARYSPSLRPRHRQMGRLTSSAPHDTFNDYTFLNASRVLAVLIDTCSDISKQPVETASAKEARRKVTHNLEPGDRQSTSCFAYVCAQATYDASKNPRWILANAHDSSSASMRQQRAA